MPKARKYQIALEATPYYHCTSRCVRRAFLCGIDHDTGTSYEHRREWIEERILELAASFCIDVCAYAVMSNHFHVVLHVNTEEADNLSSLGVCQRWHQVFNGTPLTQRYCKGEALCPAEQSAVEEKVTLWREQLRSISWFMRCLNEPIARLANAEDQCTGSFWEARFACQALLDEKALAACMAYVDLNPVRAKMADTPEASDFTSIKERIAAIHADSSQPKSLFPFVGNPREPMPCGLPFRLNDYIQLVDWTGKQVRNDKRGAISEHLPDIIERLQIDPKQWHQLALAFDKNTRFLVGDTASVASKAASFGYRRPPRSQLTSVSLQ